MIYSALRRSSRRTGIIFLRALTPIPSGEGGYMASPGATRHKGHEHTVSAKQVRRRLGAMGLLLVTDIALGLALIYKNSFISLSVGAYLLIVWDAISLWAGRIVTIAGALSPILIVLSRRRSSSRNLAAGESQLNERFVEQVIRFLLDKTPAYLSRSRVSVPLSVLLTLPAPVLSYLVIAHRNPFPVPPSAVAFSPDGTQVYVADEDNRKLLVYDAQTGKNAIKRVGIGGRPHRIVVGPRR